MAGRCGVLFFLLPSKNADMSGYIHTKVEKGTSGRFFISLKIKGMENQKMKDIKYIIADNVKLYRKKQNLTQFELERV